MKSKNQVSSKFKLDINDELSQYVRWGNVDWVLDTLEKSHSLDMRYDDGRYFDMSIYENNTAIVKALLDYFEENQLSLYREGSSEKITLKNEMRDILEISTEFRDISPEMKEVLAPYIYVEEEREELDMMIDYCKFNQEGTLTQLLEKFTDLDVTVNDGICFYYALEYNNTNMLNALIEYYNNTKLNICLDEASYTNAITKLKQIIQDQVALFDSSDISEEITQILSPYVMTEIIESNIAMTGEAGLTSTIDDGNF